MATLAEIRSNLRQLMEDDERVLVVDASARRAVLYQAVQDLADYEIAESGAARAALPIGDEIAQHRRRRYDEAVAAQRAYDIGAAAVREDDAS